MESDTRHLRLWASLAEQRVADPFGLDFVAAMMETGTPALRFLSASGEFRPPEPDPPERVVFDLRLPGPDDPHTD